MKVLVKIGGTLLDDTPSRHRLAGEIASLKHDDIRMVIVHGGGKQMTRFLAERGVESRFINGLRVTTPDVLDAVLKIFTGSVNRQLVASLVQAGILAVGLSGIDACLTEAEPISEELGAVGRPVRCNPELLNMLTESGFIPVVACVAGDRQGNIYNVNADQMAVACAAGFSANRLIFLTDVEGVKGFSGDIVPVLNIEEGERLIRDGVATGGMEAKLNAAHLGLRQGIQEIVIAPGGRAGVLERLLAEENIGSRLVI